MKVLAVSRPLDNKFAAEKVFLAGENQTFTRTLKESRNGKYFMHRGKRCFITLDENTGEWLFCHDPEPITLYITMSANYTATVQSVGGISGLESYLAGAKWGVNVDENFGRITMISGDSMKSSNTLRLAKEIIEMYVHQFVSLEYANRKAFYGKTPQMIANQNTKKDHPKHNQVLWHCNIQLK